MYHPVSLLLNDATFLMMSRLSAKPRLSAKHIFCAKLQYYIVDYSNNFQLLHFQFDSWLYKTESGINKYHQFFHIA